MHTNFDTKFDDFQLILAQNSTNMSLFKTHLIHNYRESSLKIGVNTVQQSISYGSRTRVSIRKLIIRLYGAIIDYLGYNSNKTQIQSLFSYFYHFLSFLCIFRPYQYYRTLNFTLFGHIFQRFPSSNTFSIHHQI